MTPSFEEVLKALKQLPGLGHRSAERIALNLLVEKPTRADDIINALKNAAGKIHGCKRCGNITEEEFCVICNDARRQTGVLCLTESVPDLHAIERSGVFDGVYHVLHGKLSPIKSVNPEDLNLLSLKERLEEENIEEVILALSNDVEGEATCHYIQETYINGLGIKVTRIGFGIPSGSNVVYADPATLKNALEGRRDY